MSSEVTARALAVALGAGVPTLLWGAPGTGKSSVIRATAEALGWPCQVVIASIREPSDFAGLPVVHGEQVRFAPPAWAVDLVEAGRGLLFLDEISTAPPAVQAALLRVVLERTVGDLTLPPAVVVVAAANPPDQAADGWDLSAPLANRFCHLDWTVDGADVALGFTAGFRPPPVFDLTPGIDRGTDAPTSSHARARVRARADVAAFLLLRPSLVSAPPLERSAAGRAWPSPRSWEMAAEVLAAARMAGSGPDVVTALILGCVGPGAGIEMVTWLTDLDLPDPEALLADPSSFRLPERGDQTHATLTSVAAAVAAHPTPDRWAAAWEVLAVAGRDVPDIAALAARILVRCRPEGAPAPVQAAGFLPLLIQAGIVEAVEDQGPG